MNQAKAYLNQIRELDVKIRQRRDEIDVLRETAMSQSMQLDADRIRTDSPDQDPMATKVIRYVEIQKEVEDLLLELMELKHTVIGQIHQLNDANLMTVLCMRYVELMTWEQIADDMGYSLQHVFRIHGKALEAFGQKFDIRREDESK